MFVVLGSTLEAHYSSYCFFYVFFSCFSGSLFVFWSSVLRYVVSLFSLFLHHSPKYAFSPYMKALGVLLIQLGVRDLNVFSVYFRFLPLYLITSNTQTHRKYLNIAQEKLQDTQFPNLHQDKIKNKLKGEGGINTYPLDFKKLLDSYRSFVPILQELFPTLC